MGPSVHWKALLLLSLGLACAARAHAGPFVLTAAESERVEARQVVIRSSLDSSQRRGTVRAAVRIEAPPAVVFRMMIQCADALVYVPHLRVCRVRDQAPDQSWLLVEHQIDFGWYAPAVNWTFRADLVTDRSIKFHQVSGDFKANEGLWELEPTPDGATTLLLYQAYIDPPGFVPNWLARSTWKRELPQMLADLRRRCEAAQAGPGTERAPSPGYKQ
ncbi:MAG TPA: SRPBCC family protein [Steroidobacteraceae bacterium]|nr:SRPBCC family protein [Steroidobacteraceae bacterium]